VICLIMTDGAENSSHEWTWDAVRALITQQQDQWKWTFLFIGANMDAVEVGGRIGVAPATSITYDDSDYLTTMAVSRAAREMVTSIRSGREAVFSDDDRRAAMGETT
jgi:hypothetical protein